MCLNCTSRGISNIGRFWNNLLQIRSCVWIAPLGRNFTTTYYSKTYECVLENTANQNTLTKYTLFWLDIRQHCDCRARFVLCPTSAKRSSGYTSLNAREVINNWVTLTRKLLSTKQTITHLILSTTRPRHIEMQIQFQNLNVADLNHIMERNESFSGVCQQFHQY